jgi:hypothetical protein
MNPIELVWWAIDRDWTVIIVSTLVLAALVAIIVFSESNFP